MKEDVMENSEALCAAKIEDASSQQLLLRKNPREYQISFVKSQRKYLDHCLQALKNEEPSREKALSITKVQEAIMWLGMELKRLGEENPYPNSYNPENTIVDPTADGLKL